MCLACTHIGKHTHRHARTVMYANRHASTQACTHAGTHQELPDAQAPLLGGGQQGLHDMVQPLVEQRAHNLTLHHIACMCVYECMFRCTQGEGGRCHALHHKAQPLVDQQVHSSCSQYTGMRTAGACVKVSLHICEQHVHSVVRLCAPYAHECTAYFCCGAGPWMNRPVRSNGP